MGSTSGVLCGAGKELKELGAPREAFLQFKHIVVDMLDQPTEKKKKVAYKKYCNKYVVNKAAMFVQYTKVADRTQSLVKWSQWLARFLGSDHAERLELPGQYSSSRKPEPRTHVHLESLDDAVMVMTSLRKPKRICVKGSDVRVCVHVHMCVRVCVCVVCVFACKCVCVYVHVCTGVCGCSCVSV